MARGDRVLRVVIAGDAKGAVGAIDGVASKVGGLGKVLGGLGAGLALGAVAKKVYGLGAGLEQSLNVLEQLDPTKSVGKMTSALNGQAANLAKLGYSTGEAAAALVELQKAGVDNEDTFKTLTPALTLARAGGLEVADAATAVSNALNVFKLDAGQAGRVTDVLAGAANASSASVGNLLESFQMGSAVAAQMGISIEDLSGMFAILANNGIKGSDAGTSVKTMLLRLQAPIEQSADYLEALGVKVYDAEGKIRPIGDTLGDLSTELAGLNDQARDKVLYKIFGSDAVRAGKILLDKNGKSLAQVTAEIASGSKAADVASAKTKGLSGAMNRLSALSKSAGSALYMSVGPKVGNAINGTIDRVQKFAPALSKAFKGGDTKGMGTALSGMVGGGEGTAKVFTAIANGALKVKGAVKAALASDEFAAFKAKAVAMKDGVVKAFTDAGNGTGFLGETIKRVRAIWDEIVPAAQSFIGFVRSTLIPLFVDLWNKTAPVLAQLKSTFLTVLSAIAGAIRVAVTVIKAVWGVIGPIIIGAIKGAFGGAMQAIKGALQIISGVLDFFKALFTGNWQGMWEAVKGIAVGVFNVIVGAIKVWLNIGILSFVRGGLVRLLGLFKGQLKKVPGFFSGMMNTIVTFLKSSVPTLAKKGVELIGGLIRGFTGLPKKLGSIAWDAVRGLVKGLTEAGASLIDGAVESMVEKIPGGIRKLLKIESPSKVTAELGKFAGAGLAKGIDASGNLIEDATKKAAKKATPKLTEAQKQAKKVQAAQISLGKKLAGIKATEAKKAATAQKKVAAKALKEIQKQKQAFLDAFSNSAREGAGIGDLFGSAVEGNSVSLDTAMKRLRKRLEQVKKFAANMKRLFAAGIGPAMMQEIAALGPKMGNAVAESILKGGPAGIKAVNGLYGELAAASSAGVSGIASQVYGVAEGRAAGAVARANGATVGAARQAAINNYNITVNGIKDPVKAAAEVQKQIRTQQARGATRTY